MSRKSLISIVLVLMLCAGMLASLPLTKAVDSISINSSKGSNCFSHDEEFTVSATWHGTGWFAGQIQARLLRTVQVYDANGGFPNPIASFQNAWIKNYTWNVGGWIDQDFTASFDEVLSLDNLRYGYSQSWWTGTPPYQWPNYYWLVGYTIQFVYSWNDQYQVIHFVYEAETAKLTSPWSGTAGLDSIRFGHDERVFYANSVDDYGCSSGYGQASYTDEILGAPDDYSCCLWGYYPGDNAYIVVSPPWEIFDFGAHDSTFIARYTAYYPPARWNVELFSYTWGGYDCDTYVYSMIWNDGASYMTNFHLYNTGREWINCGPLYCGENGVAYGILIQTDNQNPNGAVFFTDSVKFTSTSYYT